jgi:hypothetical protein
MKDGRMQDNRMVKDSHQEGIKRVIQRKSDSMRADHAGHQGCMSHGTRSDAGFKRTGASLTPRKA